MPQNGLEYSFKSTRVGMHTSNVSKGSRTKEHRSRVPSRFDVERPAEQQAGRGSPPAQRCA
eukprot:6189427-Pleurochrysis_carterae.AAC.3